MKKYLMLILNVFMIGNICFDFYSDKMQSVPFVSIFIIIAIFLYCLYLNSKLSFINSLVSIIGYNSFYIVSIFTLSKYLIIIPSVTVFISSILFIINITVYKDYNKLENIAKLLNIPIFSYVVFSLVLALIINKGIDNAYLFILMVIPLYFVFRVIKRYLYANNSTKEKCFDFSFLVISSILLVILLILLKDYDRYYLVMIIDYIILIPMIVRIYRNTVLDINVNNMSRYNEDYQDDNLLQDDSIIDAEFEEKN